MASLFNPPTEAEGVTMAFQIGVLVSLAMLFGCIVFINSQVGRIIKVLSLLSDDVDELQDDARK